MLCALTHAGFVTAQVIEPNGLAVPITDPTSNEQTLQTYFDGRSPPEPIDALEQASAEPATFSPRCGFEAELVLSESSAAAGLAWYNVPNDPSAAPDAAYVIMEETTQTGAVVSSNQIRSDPNYAGGLIGFALTKFGGTPVYYSEAARNATCTACSMPGPWKLMLAYPSPLEATTYYLAWEDWEGANETSWPDDGDFNDKVFRLSGVRCAGGGEPCETGAPGVCAQGLTGCSTSASAGACVPLEAASPEVCDGLDNDCDGEIDNDRPCGTDGACVNGACVQACGGVEFPCPEGQVCDQGECVDPTCLDVDCPPGQICLAGECRAPCEDVVCPLGQVCRAGVCKDPCASVTCKSGSVCRLGACLESCQCSGCPDGSACDGASGRCVDPGCEGVACAAGEACVQGACVDACQGAVCPRGVECRAGSCDSAQARTRVEPNAGSPQLFPASSADAAVAMSNAGETSEPVGAASADGDPRMRVEPGAGCDCHVAPSPTRSPWPLALSLSWLWLARARAAQRRRSTRRRGEVRVSRGRN